MKSLNTLLLIIITVLLTYLIIDYFAEEEPDEFDAPEPVVFLYGSDSVPHDIGVAELVEASVEIGPYCSDARLLIDAVEGDVVIPARANSYRCQYVNTLLLTIPVVGGSNTPEEFKTAATSSLFISNGKAYGEGVDYYVSSANLGDSMALMANIIVRINSARRNAGLEYLNVIELRAVLDASSDGEKIVEGKRYGLIINEARATEYAVNGLPPQEPCTDCGYLPAIYYILGE